MIPHISKPVSGTLLIYHVFHVCLFIRDRKHKTFVAIDLLQHFYGFIRKIFNPQEPVVSKFSDSP